MLKCATLRLKKKINFIETPKGEINFPKRGKYLS